MIAGHPHFPFVEDEEERSNCGTMNLQSIQTPLPVKVTENLSKSSFNALEEGEDELFCCNSSSGIFTSKQAYKFLRNKENVQVTNNVASNCYQAFERINQKVEAQIWNAHLP